MDSGSQMNADTQDMLEKQDRKDVQEMPNSYPTSCSAINLEFAYMAKKKLFFKANTQFILTCMGVTIGLGNVWRFPNLAFRNGCGSFIIVYTLMLVFVGFPMHYMEVLLGQFTGKGPYFCFSTMAPVASGIGIAIGMVGLSLTFYYTTIIAYIIYYFYVLTWKELPWLVCDESWGANERCYSRHNKTEVEKYLSCAPNSDSANLPMDEEYNFYQYSCHGMSSAGQQFFAKFTNFNSRENLNTTTQSINTTSIPLIISLVIAWGIIYLSVFRGLTWATSKMFFYITLIPEIMLFAFFFLLCFDKGGLNGMIYFFTPHWHRLLDFKVWKNASVQVFFSLGVGYGYIIMFNTFKPFHNDAYRDSVLLATVDFATSIVSGCVIFGLAGRLSEFSAIPIEYFSDSLFELTFALCPESLSDFPFQRISIAGFFLLLLSAAVDTQYTLIISLHHVLYEFSSFFSKRRILTPALFCVLSFVINVLFTFEAGLFAIRIIDYYVTGRVILFAAVSELVTVSWIYGTNKFCRDVLFMTQRRPSTYHRVMWGILCPVFLMVLLCIAWMGVADETVDGKKAIYGQIYPDWAFHIGTTIAAIIGIQIPAWAMIIIWLHKRHHITKVAFKPTAEWHPNRENDIHDYTDYINPPKPTYDSDLVLVSTCALPADRYGRIHTQYNDDILIFPNKRNMQDYGLTQSDMILPQLIQ